MKTLKEIENHISKILINYPDIEIPLFDTKYSEDKIIVEIEHVYYVDYYSLFYCERGSKNELIKTKDLDELIFKICEKSTWDIAYEWSLKNPFISIDSRIVWFAKHIDILQSIPLNKSYLNKLKNYYNETLKLNLFKIEEI